MRIGRWDYQVVFGDIDFLMGEDRDEMVRYICVGHFCLALITVIVGVLIVVGVNYWFEFMGWL